MSCHKMISPVERQDPDGDNPIGASRTVKRATGTVNHGFDNKSVLSDRADPYWLFNGLIKAPCIGTMPKLPPG